MPGVIRIVLATIVSIVAAAPSFADQSAASRFKDMFPDAVLFPVSKDGCCCCPDEVYGWIDRAVEGVEICCESRSPFLGGLQNSKTSLMRAGVGVFPFLIVDRKNGPTIHVAVTLPSVARKDVTEIRITADEASRSVPVTPETRVIDLLFDESRFVSYDLPTDVLTKEFLGQLAAAKHRVVNFGKEGKKTMKVSKANARSIVEMLALLDALERDFGPAKK